MSDDRENPHDFGDEIPETNRPAEPPAFPLGRPSEPLPPTPPDASPENVPGEPESVAGAPDERSSRLSHEPRTLPAPVHEPRVRTNVFLFVATLACCVYWGFIQYQQFYGEEMRGFTLNPFRAPDALLGGLPFGIAVIAFLLAHEMGHYLACRHYGIAATLPYFLPFPPPLMLVTLLPGTMGAVIRIRGVITSRRALFDIAVAGPVAGWLAALPIMAYGISQSRVEGMVEIETGAYYSMGEPLLWSLMSQVFGPEVGPSQDLVMHPLAFVGWFALLMTAFNLLPIAQLDGGHLLYALAPRWHRAGSFAVLSLMLVAGIAYWPGWMVFGAFVAVFSLMSGGFRHPRPARFEPTLGAARLVLALVALAIFATSFMLVPVTLPSSVFQ